MNRKTLACSIGSAGLALVLVAGCSEKYSAERDGKKLGEAVCDLRDATSAEEAEAARADIDEQLDDLASKHALFTAEDRNDVQNNLADLAEHAIQGNEVLAQQDLAVLERSVNNIAEDNNEVSNAAWEGFLQGVSDCTQ
jgi:hypothetical protein